MALESSRAYQAPVRARSNTPTRPKRGPHTGLYPGFSRGGRAGGGMQYRLSFRSEVLNRTRRMAEGIRSKTVGQVPVFTGLGTFTLRSLSLTSLHGLGQHSEVPPALTSPLIDSFLKIGQLITWYQSFEWMDRP